MEKKKENKSIGFIKLYAPGLLAGGVILLLVIYFVNIMFVQNKKTAVSVLVLEYTEDTSALEKQVRQVTGADEDEKIEIRSIAHGVEANKAIALTWIRARVVDVIIGEEGQLTEYAQAGYLKDLSEIEESGDFMCVPAEFDSERNVISAGSETCFGKYASEIPEVDFQKPVIALTANVTNMDNAVKLLRYFGKDTEK